MSIETIVKHFGEREGAIEDFIRAVDVYIYWRCGIGEGAETMSERPFIDINEFLEQAEIVQAALKKFKKYYFEYAAKVEGIVELDEIESLFKLVKKEIQPITQEQDNIVEAMFDSFIGAMNMGGDSDFAFTLLETQFNLFGDPLPEEEEEGEPHTKYAKCYIREEIDGILYFRHSFDMYYSDDQEIFKAAEKWIQNNMMYAHWNNCHLEIVDL